MRAPPRFDTSAIAPSLRERLRAATAARHAALDERLTALGFFSSPAGYLQFLRRSWHFQRGLECALDAAQAAEVVTDWPRRHRAQLIEHDLAALGSAPPHTVLSFRGDLRGGPAAILGAAYVLEGSTLGGQFLLKQVARLGWDARRGASFLAGHGEGHARTWNAFLACLARHDRPGFAFDEAARAAGDAFDFARDCYTLDET